MTNVIGKSLTKQIALFTNNAAQVVSTGVATRAVFNTIESNKIELIPNLTVGNYNFTIVISGYYHIIADTYAYGVPGTMTVARLQILKNNVEIANATNYFVSQMGLATRYFGYLNAGDIIHLLGTSSGTSCQISSSGGGPPQYTQIKFIYLTQ